MRYWIGKLSYWLLTPHRIPGRIRFLWSRLVSRSADPAQTLRALKAIVQPAATSARYPSLPVILMLWHGQDRGIEQHLRKLSEQFSDRARVILLKVRSGVINVSALDSDKSVDIELEGENSGELLGQLRLLGARRIHVHHTSGFLDYAQTFIGRTGLPYDLTIHDYTLVCPRSYMYREGRGYCGEPDEFGCLHCLRQSPPALSVDIYWWRWQGRKLIEGAGRVICPSNDAAMRIARYAPAANLIVVPHEGPSIFEHRTVRVPQLSAGQPMRIAVLGAMTGHNGVFFLIECISACKRAGVSVDVVLVGASLLPDTAEHMRVTGRYEPKDLPDRITAVDPHLILYPQKHPETYSYTLSEGLAAGVPLLAPDLGAFRERIAGREWCWLYDAAIEPDDFARMLQEIRAAHIEPGMRPPLVERRPARDDQARFYEDGYFAPILLN